MSLQQAQQLLAEFYAAAPTDQIRIITLELAHPALQLPGGDLGVIRLAHYPDPVTVLLEDGSPATFVAGAFSVRFPSKTTQGRRDLQLTMDAIGTDVIAQLERVSDYVPRTKITATVREYVSSDLTAPGRIESGLTLLRPRVSGGRASASLVFSDSINKSFPSEIYTLTSNPGLAE